jgi:hypothetical protein
MSYTINLTNGTNLIPGGLSDGTVDNTHTSLTLIGRDYAGYGVFLNENFIYLLENFANSSSPANPLKGQLWWDTTNNVLRVYTGTSWKISTGATSSAFNSPPSDLSALGGDLWFDTTNQQLKVYSGTQWITVGPAATVATGNTGALPAIITDTSSGSHIIIEFIIAGTIYAIFSKDSFSCNLAGFPIIKAGLNFNTQATPTLGLSTQDVNPTASTLVIRDGSGSINTTGLATGTISASTITSGAVTASALNGSLNGNVVAVSVTSTNVVSQGFNAISGYTGTLLTPSQPNITTVGNLYNLSTNGTTNLYGSAYLNGSAIATIGGPASFTSINSTPVGNVTPSSGAFTTLSASGATTLSSTLGVTGAITAASLTATGTIAAPTYIASTVSAATIGNTGTTLTGTLSTVSQPNITTLAGLTTASSLVTIGTVTTGTWNANVVSPTYGGTGVNNGSNTLTLNGSYTLNQGVNNGASPVFTGTNFTGIPISALSADTITVNAGSGLSGGGTVTLGGSTTLNLNIGNYVSTLTGTSNQVNVSSATGASTLSLPQNVHTGANFQINSLGVGTGASGTAGEIRATNNVTAYYSDDRLKTRLGVIDNALNKVLSLTGFYYQANETAQALGYEVKREVGISAQDVQRVQPETVAPAPIDEQYLTVRYERLVPLLIEAIKELKGQVDEIRSAMDIK